MVGPDAGERVHEQGVFTFGDGLLHPGQDSPPGLAAVSVVPAGKGEKVHRRGVPPLVQHQDWNRRGLQPQPGKQCQHRTGDGVLAQDDQVVESGAQGLKPGAELPEGVVGGLILCGDQEESM